MGLSERTSSISAAHKTHSRPCWAKQCNGSLSRRFFFTSFITNYDFLDSIMYRSNRQTSYVSLFVSLHSLTYKVFSEIKSHEFYRKEPDFDSLQLWGTWEVQRLCPHCSSPGLSLTCGRMLHFISPRIIPFPVLSQAWNKKPWIGQKQ